jgi:hypothetical protein
MSDDIIRVDLSQGITHFISALEQAYPGVDLVDLQTLGNAMLTSMSESVERGELLASLSRDADGRLQLRIWNIGKNGEES